ncbi:hypothetical protein SF83666_c00130 [Sinorhizobium fredii CCBAU 83666]|nr:hypothetical protein SF83666_c00130 [Sinorhizobium fredii CCBAU 83666]
MANPFERRTDWTLDFSGSNLDIGFKSRQQYVQAKRLPLV